MEHTIVVRIYRSKDSCHQTQQISFAVKFTSTALSAYRSHYNKKVLEMPMYIYLYIFAESASDRKMTKRTRELRRQEHPTKGKQVSRKTNLTTPRPNFSDLVLKFRSRSTNKIHNFNHSCFNTPFNT